MDPLVARLAVAALTGLAVGLEREWSGHATGPLARFAGIRTFFLLGALGGIAGWLAASGSMGLAVTLMAGAAALIVGAYIVAARPGGHAIDGTTEVAALAVLALGALAGLGWIEVASGATAVIVLALSEKERVGDAVRRIGADELRAALQFAVLALVVLPLLPDETYGPYGGIRVRALWIVVLIFSGLNFVGFLARRAAGPERGYGITGMLGGLISSTAVTFHFSRLSRHDHAIAPGLAVGVVGACTVLLPRVLLVSAVLNHRVAIALLPILLPPLVTGALITALALLRPSAQNPEPALDQEFRSPLRLWSAIRMALAFQAALMAIAFVRDVLGETGVLATAALLGLTDMDALTLSMNRLGADASLVSLAARAIGIGVIANSLLKLTVIVSLGAHAFRRRAASWLALLTLASVVSLWLIW